MRILNMVHTPVLEFQNLFIKIIELCCTVKNANCPILPTLGLFNAPVPCYTRGRGPPYSSILYKILCSASEVKELFYYSLFPLFPAGNFGPREFKKMRPKKKKKKSMFCKQNLPTDITD